MFVLHWPLMLLGLIGACLPWWRAALGAATKRLVAARLVSLVVFYAIGFHMIGAPYPRYGIPFRPLLYPLALLAIAAVWQLRRGFESVPERAVALCDS